MISFDFFWSESYSEKEITALILYKDGVWDSSLDVNATEISILAGTSYKLVAEYTIGDRTESITLEFTAPGAKESPETV